MQVFKCALRIMRASFVFPLIYVVGLSFMSVVLAFSAVPLDDRQSDDFERAEYVYSIIDRDNSTISHSLAEALAEGGEAIEVTDDRVAIQDAIAKGHVDYLLIIPVGYEERFLLSERAESAKKMSWSRGEVDCSPSSTVPCACFDAKVSASCVRAPTSPVPSESASV